MAAESLFGLLKESSKRKEASKEKLQQRFTDVAKKRQQLDKTTRKRSELVQSCQDLHNKLEAGNARLAHVKQEEVDWEKCKKQLEDNSDAIEMDFVAHKNFEEQTRQQVEGAVVLVSNGICDLYRRNKPFKCQAELPELRLKDANLSKKVYNAKEELHLLTSKQEQMVEEVTKRFEKGLQLSSQAKHEILRLEANNYRDMFLKTLQAKERIKKMYAELTAMKEMDNSSAKAQTVTAAKGFNAYRFADKRFGDAEATNVMNSVLI